MVVTAGDPSTDRVDGRVTVRHEPVGSGVAAAKRRLRLGGELAGLVPDALAWGLRAGGRAVAFGRGGRVDAILSSSPSHVVNLAAWYAAGRLHVPWVAEFRDLWARNPFRTGTRFRRLPDELLERVILRRASALVTVSEPLAEQLRSDHPRTPVHTIASGVDPNLIAPRDVELDQHFCALYAGRLYLGHRDLARFAVPLRAAIDRGLVDRAQVRLHVLLLDPLPQPMADALDRLGLSEVLELAYDAPRDEVILRQRRAQILLHLRWDDPSERGIITGKIYEYLAARRPILSTGRARDVVVDLLERTGAGLGATSDEEVIAWLGEAFAACRETGRVPYAGRDDVLEGLDLRGAAAGMVRVLDDAVAPG